MSVRPDAMTDTAIGIDIGGTKIRGLLVDRQGAVHGETRVPTNAQQGAASVLASIVQSVNTLREAASSVGRSVQGIGISSAGVIEPVSGLVVSSAPQIPGWEGTNLKQAIGTQCALPVIADNDANCALVGEVWHGQHGLMENASVVMLTLGTGLGGALMINGALITGAHHLTGHYGIAQMWDRYGGSYVKVEHLVSGTGLGNVYRQLVPNAHDATGASVIAAVQAGDVQAREALSRWCEHLAMQLFNIFWQVDPDRIILGGGMIDSREVWWPQLMTALNALDTRGQRVPLAVASLGNDAGAWGAARLVFSSRGSE
jgi:glucokinase